jgi:hypothetical protein
MAPKIRPAVAQRDHAAIVFSLNQSENAVVPPRRAVGCIFRHILSDDRISGQLNLSAFELTAGIGAFRTSIEVSDDTNR